MFPSAGDRKRRQRSMCPSAGDRKHRQQSMCPSAGSRKHAHSHSFLTTTKKCASAPFCLSSSLLPSLFSLPSSLSLLPSSPLLPSSLYLLPSSLLCFLLLLLSGSLLTPEEDIIFRKRLCTIIVSLCFVALMRTFPWICSVLFCERHQQLFTHSNHRAKQT